VQLCRYGVIRQMNTATYQPLRKKITIILGAITLLASGCSQGHEETPSRKSTPDFGNIPGQFPVPATLTENGSQTAPVGACVNVSGPPRDATLTIVGCGTRENTYRVIRRVVTPDQCQDADRPFYSNTSNDGEWTACLDLAWDNNYCINISKQVTKVACDDPSAKDKYKAVKIVISTVTKRDCGEDGYAHPVRQFTICTETQK
jgi:hypothetical protein